MEAHPPLPLDITESVFKLSSAGLLRSSAPIRTSLAESDTKSADLIMSSLVGFRETVPSVEA